MFKLFRGKSELYVQDCRREDTSDILKLTDRKSGLAKIEKIDKVPTNDSVNVSRIHAVYGIYQLLSGPYLAVISDANIAGTGPSGERFLCASNMVLVPINSMLREKLKPRELSEEDSYILMILGMIRSRTFYFSYDYPLVISQQKRHETGYTIGGAKSGPIDSILASPFFFNYPVAQDFIVQGFHNWIIPMINGFIRVAQKCEVNGTRFDFIFITRRSWKRIGTRFCVRGVDKEGNVANFAETEMIIIKQGGGLSSFVQIRGSIPLYWDQLATLKYMPRTRYVNYSRSDNALDWNELAFEKHFDRLTEEYGEVAIVNLIDRTGKSSTVRDQAQLGTAYGKYAKKYRHADQLKYIWFDFHHECRKLQWQNLGKLISEVESDVERYGWFEQNEAGVCVKKQTGIFRVNCMDNLDRTNVVQSLFARRCLLLSLDAFDKNYPNVLDSPYSNFERIFKAIWADNADMVSNMYAGTGALKTDFTRTGKRTLMGALKDGVNSVTRYCLNNFSDGYRQDTYDLFVCNYVPKPKKLQSFSFQQRHPVLSFGIEVLVTLCLLVLMLIPFTKSIVEMDLQISVKNLVSMSIFILLVVAYLILKKGKFRTMGRHIVNKPLFCVNGYPKELKYNITTKK